MGTCLWLLGEFYYRPPAFCLFTLLHFAEPWDRPLPQPRKAASIRMQGVDPGEGKVSEVSALPWQLWVGQHSWVCISSPKGCLKHKMPSFLQHKPSACLQDALPPQANVGKTPLHSERHPHTDRKDPLLCTLMSTLPDHPSRWTLLVVRSFPEGNYGCWMPGHRTLREIRVVLTTLFLLRPLV